MNVKRLLDFIGAIETAPPTGNYNAIYGHANAKGDLSVHTIDQIIAVQTERIKQGAKSSAIGKYQFIRGTLQDLKRKLKLTGDETFLPEMQDRLATELLRGRGLNFWVEGRLKDETFANNLAMEWASLPVVTPIRGAHRPVKPGQSYYAGDDLNRSLTSPQAVLACLAETKADNEWNGKPAPAPDPAEPTLRPGDNRFTVQRFQAALNAAWPRIEADGDFGPKTTAAVMAFQRMHGLEDDGIVGPDTWAALKASNPQGD